MNCQRCNCTNHDVNLKHTETDSEGNVIKCSICNQPVHQIGEYVLDALDEARYLLGNFINRSACQTKHQVEEIAKALKIQNDWMRILGCVFDVDTDNPE